MTKITKKTSKPTKPLRADQLEVCNRLRAVWDARKDILGLTQESVASAMKKRGNADGITQGAIGHFLSGRKSVPIERIFWFAELLRVHPCDIDPKLPDRLPSTLGDLLDRWPPTQPLHRSSHYHLASSKSLTIHDR